MINLPPRLNTLQQTLDDIIEKQANEIHRLHDELHRETYRCLRALDELELVWYEQVKQFLEHSFE